MFQKKFYGSFQGAPWRSGKYHMYGVWDRMCHSTVSVPDHYLSSLLHICVFYYFYARHDFFTNSVMLKDLKTLPMNVWDFYNTCGVFSPWWTGTWSELSLPITPCLFCLSTNWVIKRGITLYLSIRNGKPGTVIRASLELFPQTNQLFYILDFNQRLIPKIFNRVLFIIGAACCWSSLMFLWGQRIFSLSWSKIKTCTITTA